MSCYSECFKNPTWRDVLVLENTELCAQIETNNARLAEDEKDEYEAYFGTYGDE
jgi:hypothetical protein